MNKAPGSPASFPSRKILLVEDDSSLRGTVAEFLRSNGYDTIEASTGALAFRSIEENRPGLILLDLGLPDMDGREVARWIAENHPTLPFVVLTGQEDVQAAVEMMKLGARDFLNKNPRMLDLLPPVIERVFSEVQREQRLEESEKRKDELEEQIRQAEKLESLGLLTRWITHEFNNALAAVMGYTRLALEDLDAASLTAANLRQVLEASHRARDLVDQFLQFGSESEPEKTLSNLPRLLDEILETFSGLVPPDVKIVSRCSTARGNIAANVEHLKTLFLNILVNALEAIGQDSGEIEVELREVTVDPVAGQGPLLLDKGSYYQVSVRDSGKGMEASQLSRVFEPFYTTKSRFKGRGMGLAIAFGIATNHGGTIEAMSTPGRGSTFTVFLPIEPSESIDSGEAVLDPEKADFSGEILFVDDEAPLANLGKMVLERAGFRVTALTNPHQALAAFKEDPARYGLVVTDQVMPEMKGETLAKEILSIRPQTPILLITGSAAEMNRIKARSLGFADCLIKPVMPNEIRSAVERILAQ
jgi:DNA-binding response OmpR family regulator